MVQFTSLLDICRAIFGPDAEIHAECNTIRHWLVFGPAPYRYWLEYDGILSDLDDIRESLLVADEGVVWG